MTNEEVGNACHQATDVTKTIDPASLKNRSCQTRLELEINCSLTDLIRESRIPVKEEDTGHPSPCRTRNDAKDEERGGGLQARKEGYDGVDCGLKRNDELSGSREKERTDRLPRERNL